jgi:hypothetical protein
MVFMAKLILISYIKVKFPRCPVLALLKKIVPFWNWATQFEYGCDPEMAQTI